MGCASKHCAIFHHGFVPCLGVWLDPRVENTNIYFMLFGDV